MGVPLPQSMNNQSLTVVDNRTGKSYTIPISNNSIPATAFKKIAAPFEQGERLENETDVGLRVFDPGYMNTAVIQSTITFIDGEKGILRYRGYPIEQLAEKSSFLEVAYLLLYGSLPTKDQFTNFEQEVMHHSYTHRDLDQLVESFRYNAHPMSILAASFAALGSFAPEANPSLSGADIFTKGDPTSLALLDKQIFRLIGKSTNLAAMAYRIRQGRPFNKPRDGLSYTGSFLYLLDYLNEEDYEPNPVIAAALDTLFILHADHELNCSTATVLQVGSSLADPYSAVAAGITALYGVSHGGACEETVRMLLKIGSPKNVPAFIEQVKSKKVKLSGYGHRVYTSVDPRSVIIKKTAEKVFAITGESTLLATAEALNDAASKDEYFVSRKLFPNVDYWSGLIYYSLGFPLDFFPVLFAVPRVVGWLSHLRQMLLQDGGVKIWRPRQVYVGSGARNYVEIGDRVNVAVAPRDSPSVVSHLQSKRVLLGRETARESKL